MSNPSEMPSEVCCPWDNGQCEGTEYCPPRCPRFFDLQETGLLAEPYEPDHRAGLETMYEQIDSYSRTLGLPPSSHERTEEWLDHLTAQALNIVALDGDRVIGHIAAVPLDDEEPQFVVFVHQEYQDRGVGTELVKQLIAYADAHEFEGLQLSVASGNRRAIHVYDNLGFDVNDHLQAELSMHLSLDSAIADEVSQPPADRD